MVRIRLFIGAFAIYSRPAEEAVSDRALLLLRWCFSNVSSHVMCMAEECLPGRPEMSDVSRCTPGVCVDEREDFVQVAGEQGLLASS